MTQPVPKECVQGLGILESVPLMVSTSCASKGHRGGLGLNEERTFSALIVGGADFPKIGPLMVAPFWAVEGAGTRIAL
jgi:hypothetical protein